MDDEIEDEVIHSFRKTKSHSVANPMDLKGLKSSLLLKNPSDSIIVRHLGHYKMSLIIQSEKDRHDIKS